MTDTIKIQEQMATLQAEIEHHNKLYYVNAAPQISDHEYDLLLKRLEALEAEHPQFASSSSPSLRVGGAPLDGFQNVAHAVAMKSLSNTYNKEELTEFDERIKKLLTGESFTYVLEPKIDGVAISLRYENGELTQALTRGDGTTGDDVTANIRTIKSIPLRLHTDNAPSIVEVRGEIYMDKQGFADLNTQRQEDGLEPFANPRNACAGSLKQLDSRQVAKRPLDAIFYATGQLDGVTFDTHKLMLTWMQNAGLTIAPQFWCCDTIEEVIGLLDELHTLHTTFPFEMDGAVIKVNERHLYQQLGSTAKSPRWAVAYKYAPEQAETLLTDITIQVGRTGVLTPVAELEAVALSGSTVRRATLHNAEEIARKDVRIGDHVIVEKAGEIIPAIVKVVTEKRTGNEAPFHMPTQCPICDNDVVQRSGEVALRCINLQCPAQLKTWLEHFVSRDALDVEGLGGIVCDKLIESELVKTPMDLFKLTTDDLDEFNLGSQESPRMLGAKNASKIVSSIQKAKTKPLGNWLFALGIPKLGKVGAQIIAQKHRTIEEVATSPILNDIIQLNQITLEAKKIKKEDPTAFASLCDQLEKIGDRIVQLGWYKKNVSKSATPSAPKYTLLNHQGIGNKTAESVLQFMDIGRGKEIIDAMSQYDIHPSNEEKQSQTLLGKSFVITGTLPNLKRAEAAKLISDNGGTVSSSISKNTTYLLAGEKAGSKLTKAQALGVDVISEEALLKLLE